jgi:hypothetical protein
MRYFNLVLVLFIVIFFSCEDVENNRRLLVKGNFVSDNLTPISYVEVFTTFSNNTNPTTTNNFIGQDFSGDNGKFQFTSLVPKSQNVNLVINRNTSNVPQDDFMNRQIILFEIENEIFQDIDKISLDNFFIPTMSSLDVTITKTSMESAELNWSLIYNELVCERYITDLVELQNLSFCDQTNTINFTNNDEDPSFTRNITTITNSNAIFTYSLNGQSEEQIEIPINNSSTNFHFEF